MQVDTLIIGDFDIRGRYLPTALTRLDSEAFLGWRESSQLSNFQDRFTGRRLSLEDIDTLHQAAREERGETVPTEERCQNLWDSAWEILEDSEGLSYITAAGVEWTIRRNANGDLVLVDETAAKAIRHNTVGICRDCLELIEDVDIDADQEQRRAAVIDALGIDSEDDLQPIDDSDLYWIGYGESAGATIDDHCYTCESFASLKPFLIRHSAERDYDQLARENGSTRF